MLSCVQPNLATMQRHYPPKHLFSHCHQIYCLSQDDDESLSEKQIDIESFSLDEITEAVASLVIFIKIYPVVLNHGIAHDYGEQQKKQCHEKNSLFLFRESLNYIFHGAKIVFFFQKRCRIHMFRCRIPIKKVSHSYECDTFLTYFFISRCVFLLFIEKWVILLFILCGYIFSHFLLPFGRSTAFL